MKINFNSNSSKLPKLILSIVLVVLFSGMAKAEFDHFVTASNGKLYDGDKEVRWCSVNVPFVDYTEDGEGGTWKELTPWEQEDLIKTIVQMGGKVIRRYALSTRQPGKIYEAHVQGPGEFSEKAFVAFDRFLALCNQYDIRVIVPFVDQYNYNWVGGVGCYQAFRGLPTNDDGRAFVTNQQVRKDFKATIDYVLNRVNTVTGIKYKDDKAILAWETGNELWCENKNYNWVTDIAAYVKSIDSNHLLIDGDMPRTVKGLPSMTDPNIDIVSNHYYKWSNGHENLTESVKIDLDITRGKKPFIVGEYGLTNPTDLKDFIRFSVEEGVAGMMLWSLRGHREAGGFWQHAEGDWMNDGTTYWAYHWPGFPINDNYGETEVIRQVYKYAYEIDGEVAPEIPIPEPPVLLPINNATKITWKGSVGAINYDVERSLDNRNWQTIGSDISDMYKNFAYPDNFKDTDAPERGGYYRVKAKNNTGISASSNVVVYKNPPIYVPLSKESLDTISGSVEMNFTRQMHGIILPSYEAVEGLSFHSSSDSVATIDENGVITGNSIGETIITLTLSDQSLVGVCHLTVEELLVASVSVSPRSFLLHVNSTQKLSAVINPEKASNQTVTWASDNTSIATVNNKGEITGIAEGECDIIATTNDGAFTSNCHITVASNLPEGWMSTDIGKVAAAGGAGMLQNAFIVKGSGYDIEENYDEFHFAYLPKSGDLMVTARVLSVDATSAEAKAGVMIRETLSNNAKMTFMPLTAANGTFFQNRLITNGISRESKVISGLLPPYWVRVVRSGNTVVGYSSPDGENWNMHGKETIKMNDDVFAGLAVTSHKNGVICTAIFDHVSFVDTTFQYTAVDDFAASNIKIYPNPCYKQPLMIDFGAVEGSKTVKLCSVFGQLFYETETKENNLTINSTNFKPGIYIATIYTKEKYFVKQILIQ